MTIPRFLRWAAAALLMMTLGAQVVFAQQSESRFAFVIGNDGYEEAPLATSANDAALVADALRTAGFDVTGARNLDLDTFRASYREFLANNIAILGPILFFVGVLVLGLVYEIKKGALEWEK